MTTPQEPKPSRTLTKLTELGRDGVQRPTKSELDQGLNALYSRITAGRVRHRERVRWALMSAAAVMTVLAVLQLASISRKHLGANPPQTLAYEIQGGTVLEGGYLHESAHTGIKLSFNEGSRFELLPGTRARLRSVDKDGARVAIENGTASFEVVPDSSRRWSVEVGPFLVTVKGTMFMVAWDPSSERFELRLRRGRVVVSGPVSGGDLALRAGQRLLVNLPKAETLITEDAPGENRVEAPIDSAPSSASSLPPSPSVALDRASASNPTTGSTPSTPSKAEPERGWASELAHGHWDRILADVERAGLEASLNKASSEDLFALADAARYRRRPDLARAALLAERRRFPDSKRALDALFLLGRVEDSRAGGTGRALALYNEYLSRAPTGAYAAEALGRKMTITNEVNGPAQARPIAEEYLRRFPNGSYAGSARALLRVP
jgi:TolA-binding protein